jgi:hypothetical protein
MATVSDFGKYRIASGGRAEVVEQLADDERKPEDVVQFEFDSSNSEFYAVYQLR